MYVLLHLQNYLPCAGSSETGFDVIPTIGELLAFFERIKDYGAIGESFR
jgi:hypothetical protein